MGDEDHWQCTQSTTHVVWHAHLEDFQSVGLFGRQLGQDGQRGKLAAVVVARQQVKQHVHALGRMQLQPKVVHVDVCEAREQLGCLVLAATLCFLAVEHGDERLDSPAVEQAHAVVEVAAQSKQQRDRLRARDGGGVVAGEQDDAVVNHAGFAERSHAAVCFGDVAQAAQRLRLGVVGGRVDQLRCGGVLRRVGCTRAA